MRKEEIIVNVIFDAAKGNVSVASREAVTGMPYGALPRPVRSGYTFEGWYLDGKLVTEDTVLDTDEDVRLVAHWARKTGGKKNSMLKKQRVAVVVLAVVAVVLVGVLLFVNHIVSIYGMVDTYYGEDGTEYTEKYYIRKKNGTYGLYDKDGNLMEVNDDGYYLAKSGNQYSVDPETGDCELYAVVDYDAAGGEVLGFSDRIMMFPQITQKNTYSIKVTNEHGTYEFYRDESGTVHIKGTEEAMVSYDQTLFASLCVSCGYTLSMQKLDLTSEASVAPRLEDGSVDYSAYGLADLYDEEGNLTYTPAVYTITKAIYDEDGTCKADPDTVYSVKVGDAILSGAGYYVQLVGRDAVYIVSSDIANTVLQPVEALVTPMITYPLTVSTYAMVNNFILGNVDFKGSFDSEALDEIKIDPIVAFTYLDLESRTNSIYTSRPYLCQTELMEGYEINSDNASGALGLLYEIEFVACRKLGITKEALHDYGLDENVYYLAFESPVLDGNNNIAGYISNAVIIGEKTENGTYYVASFLTDMIVEVDQYYMSFLEWEKSDWYEQYFFQHNISYITEMGLKIGGKEFNFTLDNSASYMYYEKSDGTMTQIDLSKGTIERSSDGTVTYVDGNGSRHNVYVFDFDTGSYYIRIYDSDGNTVAYAPYEKFLITTDRSGIQKLSVYSKDSSGTETRKDYELTKKVDGSVKQVLSYRLIYRDASGAEFDVLGTYTGSDGNSYKDYYRLANWQELYDETEKTYYWNRTEPVAGSTLLRNANGKEFSFSVGSSNLLVYCDQYTGGKTQPNLLDYTIVHTYTTDSGAEKTEQITAVTNFRKLYSLIMWYSIEGDANEADFEKNMGMTVEEYIAQGDDVCQMIFTYRVQDQAKNMNLDTGLSSAEDKAPEVKEHTENNSMDVVVRLYRYSERKSLITIETIKEYDENGDPISDPTNAEGSFYVLSTYADQLLSAAERLLAQERVETD